MIHPYNSLIDKNHTHTNCRNSLHRRLLDGSPRMSTLNATSPNDSSQIDVSLSAYINGDSSLHPMPSGTSSLVLRRPSANMFVSNNELNFPFCVASF